LKIQTGGKAVFCTWFFIEDRNIQAKGKRKGIRIRVSRM
jgi:hypothetical protein